MGTGTRDRIATSSSSLVDVVGQCLEGEHEAVAHDVERHVADVLRQDVVAAADRTPGHGP